MSFNRTASMNIKNRESHLLCFQNYLIFQCMNELYEANHLIMSNFGHFQYVVAPCNDQVELLKEFSLQRDNFLL